jgi:hypothetical protein
LFWVLFKGFAPLADKCHPFGIEEKNASKDAGAPSLSHYLIPHTEKSRIYN